MRTKFTLEQVEEIAAKLREMPAVEPRQLYSRREAVRLLAKEINALQKRGYTLEHVTETLRGAGFSIAVPTLQGYLRRVKGKAERRTKDTLSSKSASIPHKTSSFDPFAIYHEEMKKALGSNYE